MDKRNCIIVCILIGFICLMLFALDYYDVLSKNNIDIWRINIDFWSTLISSAIVIALYIITYVLIDKRRIKQEENKRNVANLLLRKIYSECLDDIKRMESKDYRIAMASKINFDNSIGDEPVYQQLMDSPFDNHEMILSFAKEGVIKAETLEKYLNVKREFRVFIIASMTFYDRYEIAIKLKGELDGMIEDALRELE